MTPDPSFSRRLLLGGLLSGAVATGFLARPLHTQTAAEHMQTCTATGKANGAPGMALRWLKPLQQGFDVKLVAGARGLHVSDDNAGQHTPHPD